MPALRKPLVNSPTDDPMKPASFDSWLTKHQIEWRRRHLSHLGAGLQNGKSYEWIVPRIDWKDLLWEGRNGPLAKVLGAYIRDSKISIHSGVHNLKSSWVLCANLYFPFGQQIADRALLADFLR